MKTVEEQEEYKKKLDELISWVLSKFKYSKKEAKRFAENILRKKYPELLKRAIKETEEFNENEKREKRIKYESLVGEYYGNKKTVPLTMASVGEVFVFVSKSCVVYLLECTGTKEMQGYDPYEWCVSEREYTYELPVFTSISSKGVRENAIMKGMARKLTKKQHDKLLNKLKNAYNDNKPML